MSQLGNIYHDFPVTLYTQEYVVNGQRQATMVASNPGVLETRYGTWWPLYDQFSRVITTSSARKVISWFGLMSVSRDIDICHVQTYFT